MTVTRDLLAVRADGTSCGAGRFNDETAFFPLCLGNGETG